ncbi:MAG: hypothetical protein IT426_07825 [Pirellulales bacterium]|nr:hypothetical protein [Pirellulales bacterium]
MAENTQRAIERQEQFSKAPPGGAGHDLRAFLLGKNVNRSFCGFPVYLVFDGSRIANPKFMEDKEMESELSHRDAEIERLKSRLAELPVEKILAEGDARGGITFAMIESMAHEAGKDRQFNNCRVFRRVKTSEGTLISANLH